MPPKASTSTAKAAPAPFKAGLLNSGSTSKIVKTAVSKMGPSSSHAVAKANGAGVSDGKGDEARPVASTSAASSSAPPVRMTQLEILIHTAVLAAPKQACRSLAMQIDVPVSAYLPNRSIGVDFNRLCYKQP